MQIDWSRVAEPQEDQYDTEVTLRLVTGRVTPEHPTPYQRRPVGFAPTIFDGQVAVRYLAPRCPGHPKNLHGPLKHPNIDAAVEYVRRWPRAFTQFQRLMDTFHPMVDATIPPEEWNVRIGSNSHSDEDKFGTMYGTVFDAMGLSEAMVHEMAHNKLRGLGIFFERAMHLVTNPQDERYESPIRKDIMRPMTAVLHAQYSFIYVTALNLEVIAREEDPDRLKRMMVYLGYNVPRMELGYEEITRHIQVDADGRKFLDGFLAWSDRVLEEGNRVLDRHGVKKAVVERVFTH